MRIEPVNVQGIHPSLAGSNAAGHDIEFVVMQDARVLSVRGDIRFHDFAPDLVGHGLAKAVLSQTPVPSVGFTQLGK